MDAQDILTARVSALESRMAALEMRLTFLEGGSSPTTAKQRRKKDLTLEQRQQIHERLVLGKERKQKEREAAASAEARAKKKEAKNGASTEARQ